jgi:hypothetical protein
MGQALLPLIQGQAIASLTPHRSVDGRTLPAKKVFDNLKIDGIVCASKLIVTGD